MSICETSGWQHDYSVMIGSGPPPPHLGWERGRNSWELLKNNLLNLTLPRRHFLLLAIRKIDD